jgi:hypothetical protein
MKKINLFQIYKFQSKILDDEQYNVSRTIDEAKVNKEIISLGDNQVLRTIRDIRNKAFDINELSLLKKKKKDILIHKNNNTELLNIENQIDNMTFCPDYVCVIVNEKKHYDYILKNGCIINGKIYHRLLCSAGHARHSKVMLINSEIEREVKKRLNAGRGDIEIEYAKFNAYFALSSSATFVIPEPRICVIDDYEFEDIKEVYWVSEDNNEDYKVDILDKELEFNAFDGQGIATPEYMKKVGETLEVNYIPAAMTLRNAFIKGMVCTIDYKLFYNEYCKNKGVAPYITDIWGDKVNILKTDMILTKSQTKMWKAYKHCYDYIKGCKDNNLKWGCARITPKNDEMFTFSNYQYIQALNLSKENIKNVIKPTVDWINSIINDNSTKGILYLMGESIRNELINDKNVYNSINKDYAKALMINNEIINDPYIKQKIKKSLDKKIKEAKLGKLLLRGNFQVMISDPFAFCEHLFGLPVKGLLEDKQHYSHFWNEIGSNRVAGMRSPLTWRSEVNDLHLIHNKLTEKWFKYLNSGIIYNIHGVDCMLHADSDFDFDIVCTTDCPDIVYNTYGGLPVTYKKKKALKHIVPKDYYENEENELDNLDIKLGKIDELSFQNAIGRVTNYSTSMYAMLPLFNKDSEEYKKLIERLIITRKCQGDSIDAAKGIQVKPYPKQWYDYWSNIIEKDDDKKVKKQKEFNLKILAEKKPYFMRYLYKKCNNEYITYFNNRNFASKVQFDCSVEKLKNELDKMSEEEYNSEDNENKKKFIELFYKQCPLNTSNCIMNMLCRQMEKENFAKMSDKNFNYMILLDKFYSKEEIKLIKNTNEYKIIYRIYKEFISNKLMFRKRNCFKNNGIDKYDSVINYDKNLFYYNTLKKILKSVGSLSIGEIAVIATIICYDVEKKHYDFLWDVCKDGLFYNLMKRNNGVLNVPTQDEEGDIEYLYKRYSMKQIKIDRKDW